MKQLLRVIDGNGYHLYDIIRDVTEEQPLQDNEITARPHRGLWRAKWTGTEWEETMSQEEIEALNTPSEPTFEDLQIEQNVDFDYRLSLIEMGLIE